MEHDPESTYDAAGNQTYDGLHHYTYDGEGNITAVDSGQTATYTYDALNHRVETTASGATTDFVFNAAGQRVSEWNASTHALLKGHYYWGSKPLAFYTTAASNDPVGNGPYYQHQDWEGTERMRTDANGSEVAQFTSLPFGDAQTQTAYGAYDGYDLDANHFAMLDFDSETNTDHAQFRQYSPTEGRWLRPDPYAGSYDPGNPQSMNRYTYALNSPLSNIDPSGLDCGFDEDGFDTADCGGSGGDPGDGWYGDGFGQSAGPGGGGAGSDNPSGPPGGGDLPYFVYIPGYGFLVLHGSANEYGGYGGYDCIGECGYAGQGSGGGGGSGGPNGHAPNNPQPIMPKCNQAGQDAANSVPSPVPNTQDQIEAWGGAAIGFGVGVATSPEDGPLAPLVAKAASGAVTGFFHTAIVRSFQKLVMREIATTGCIAATTGGSPPLIP